MFVIEKHLYRKCLLFEKIVIENLSIGNASYRKLFYRI